MRMFEGFLAARNICVYMVHDNSSLCARKAKEKERKQPKTNKGAFTLETRPQIHSPQSPVGSITVNISVPYSGKVHDPATACLSTCLPNKLKNWREPEEVGVCLHCKTTAQNPPRTDISRARPIRSKVRFMTLLLLLLFSVYWQITNQLHAYLHLLYRTLYICKCTSAIIRNVKTPKGCFTASIKVSVTMKIQIFKKNKLQLVSVNWISCGW